MITFKVWLHIERHDDRTDEYRDVDLPHTATAEFQGRGALAKAEELCDQLHVIGRVIAPEPARQAGNGGASLP